MNVVLMGVQGSGKGTQAEKLSKLKDWKHINIGELFRRELETESQLSKKIKSYVLKGELVPDEITFEMIESAQKGDVNGLIFDGFPRNEKQAEYLVKHTKIDGVIVLELPEEESIKRITARRHCLNCKANYNLLFKPPQKEGICDKCGGKLAARADDTLPEIKRRIQIYRQQEESILAVCRNNNIPILKINGNQSIEEIFGEILQAVKKLS